MLKKRLLTGLLTLCMSVATLVTPYKPVQAAAPKLSYSAHVSTIGWQRASSSGGTAGTTGRNLAMEGLKVTLNSGRVSGVIGRAHCAEIGWQGWRTSNQTMGTTGQNRQMEAIQLKLQNGLEKQYNIVYRAHISTIGWGPWVSNGATAGTTGRGLRMEAVQIKLEPKATLSSFRYRTHVSTRGWMPFVGAGATAGTTGQEKQIEAFTAELIYGGRSAVTYRLHLADIGWENWKTSGQIAGTVGQNRRAEAIQIKLQNGAENYYDIYTRVHCQNFGWLGWAKNGATAGTTGYGYRMEAVQIRVVPKGTAFSTGGAASKIFSGNPGNTAISGSGFQYPLTKAYVCGNDWATKYSARPSRPYHVGMDIKSATGDKIVYATATGTVVATGTNSANGKYIVLAHNLNGKTVYSFYAHLSVIYVTGGSVQKGSRIGKIGNTGSSSAGEHLHFAIVDKLLRGNYYGYVTYFTGNRVTYGGVTYYNPKYIINNNRLP